MHTLDSLDPPAAPPRRAPVLALAAAGALVPALILAATGSGPLVLASVPAVTFGIPALTAPALYVGITLVGEAPPLTAVARAIGRALVALAIVQLGLAVPAGFLVATASPATAHAIVAFAVALASAVAVLRLLDELTPPAAPPPDLGRRAVEWAWLLATVAIVARTYADAVGGAS